MHARPQVKEILIAKKLRHWWVVATCPLMDPRCPTARARKYYSRLFHRYPEIAGKLGLHEWSALARNKSIACRSAVLKSKRP
jgi:hypothetical protein